MMWYSRWVNECDTERPPAEPRQGWCNGSPGWSLRNPGRTWSDPGASLDLDDQRRLHRLRAGHGTHLHRHADEVQPEAQRDAAQPAGHHCPPQAQPAVGVDADLIVEMARKGIDGHGR